MATKNNRRILVTKRILKESLLELMQHKPISKISIKEICDLSEMSRSTFYLHYQDQFELLKDIENDVLENTFSSLDDLNNALGAINSIEQFLGYVRSSKETFGVLLCQTETEDFQNAILEKIENHIKTAIPELLENNTNKYYFTFIMHGCINVIRTWIKNDFDSPIDELAQVIFYSCNNIAGKK